MAVYSRAEYWPWYLPALMPFRPAYAKTKGRRSIAFPGLLLQACHRS